MLNNDYMKLGRDEVEHILQYSGTIIKSARSERFKTDEGGIEAARNLDAQNVDAFIVIGGDFMFGESTCSWAGGPLGGGLCN